MERRRNFYFAWLVMGVMGLSWLGVQPVWAEPPIGQPGDIVFEDDFSQGLAKWKVARGSVLIWQATGGMAEGLVSPMNTISELVPKPEFWNSAWRNYEYEVDMLPISGVDRNLAWGYQDANNWYEVHLLPNMFELARKTNGFLDWYKAKNFLFNNVWHHLKIRTVGGQLDFWIDDVLAQSFTESAYAENPGTIALKVGTGLTAPTRVQFDNVKVRLLADPRAVDLAVPAVRQDDPAWASQTYDHSEKWTGQEPSTLSRWGCALTSAVMVLRFHGFSQLSDEAALTPANLNAWLLTQPDGYVADGWVNWIALMRLARELREQFSTSAHPLPQLRYTYQSWADWTQGSELVRAELNQRRPAILELPNHFVVARGFTNDATQWLIRDPASSAEQLSQLNKTPTSARLFEASTAPQTLDLSYWFIAFRRGLRVKVFDDQERLVAGWWVSQDRPGAAENGTDTTEDWVAMTLPHPPTGRFTVELGRATGNPAEDGAIFPTAELPTLAPFELQIFHYDSLAQVTTWSQKGSLGQSFPRWIFETNEDNTLATFQTQFSWRDWRTSLRQIEMTQRLPRLALARLDHVAQLAEVTEQKLLEDDSADGEAILATQSQLNQRYAWWLNGLLSQITQTWPVVKDRPEIAHLQNQLKRWLESHLSN